MSVDGEMTRDDGEAAKRKHITWNEQELQFNEVNKSVRPMLACVGRHFRRPGTDGSTYNSGRRRWPAVSAQEAPRDRFAALVRRYFSCLLTLEGGEERVRAPWRWAKMTIDEPDTPWASPPRELFEDPDDADGGDGGGGDGGGSGGGGGGGGGDGGAGGSGGDGASTGMPMDDVAEKLKEIERRSGGAGAGEAGGAGAGGEGGAEAGSRNGGSGSGGGRGGGDGGGRGGGGGGGGSGSGGSGSDGWASSDDEKDVKKRVRLRLRLLVPQTHQHPAPAPLALPALLL